MKLNELKEILDGWDEDAEVEIRITSDAEDADTISFDEFEGEYCQITSETSVLFENGRVVIIGDWNPDD